MATINGVNVKTVAKNALTAEHVQNAVLEVFRAAIHTALGWVLL